MLSDKLPPLSNITRGSLTCSRPLESKKASYYLFFFTARTHDIAIPAKNVDIAGVAVWLRC